MIFYGAGILALAAFSVASSVDYKFTHDPVSLGNSELDVTASDFHRELASLSQPVDYAGYGQFSSVFESMYFPPEQYTRFQGLDDTALFATSVSVSNDFAIIGSNGYNIYQGIVHVYTPINQSAWAVHSTILSPDGPNINFGLSVDHSGEFLIVGANALDAYKGAAYIYQYVNNKYWILTTRLYSPFGVTQGFGFKVAIDGHTAVVATSINEVSVYQYDTISQVWSNTLQLSGQGSGDRFGNSIDVYGNYMVIGAPRAANGRGLVYVYKNTGSSWSLDNTLDNPGSQWQFGYSVSLYNSTLAVGAVGYREDTFKPVGSDSAINTGHAYIFEYSSFMGKYALQVLDIASPVGQKSYFGVFVSLAKDKLIVGADGIPFGNNTGAAFVYFRNSNRPREDATAWGLNYSLPSPAGNNGHFGYAVDICDDYAVSGAYGFDDLRGSVYLIGFPKYQPTPAPTAPPVDAGGAQSFNSVTSAVAKQQKMMEILAIGVLSLVGVLTSACCIYLCCIPVAPKKKKKEEEEESPYTVHSYVGYSEMDEYMPPQAPPPQWMPFFPQMPMMPMMMVPPPMPMMPMEMEKKKMMDEKDVDLKKADENFVRKLFPYKVYGPRGYEEDHAVAEGLDRDMREADKAAEDNSSMNENQSYYTSEPQQTRKPFSMETIRESEHEDETSSEDRRLAAKNASAQQQQRSLPYTYSSQYNMQGFQQYDNNHNSSQFFAPNPAMGDESSSVSSQPSHLYGAAMQNPHMFVPQQFYPYAHQQQPVMMAPPQQQQQQAPADYSSDSSSKYVSMAKQSYAKFRKSAAAHADDDDASVSTSGSSGADRPVSVSHSERVRTYANDRSSSDLASTTSNSDDSFVKRAKERYMQFLMKKNLTKEEHEAEDSSREQSYGFLQAAHPQDDDDATVSTMSTVKTESTGMYSESSAGSNFSHRSSNSLGGVLNLRPTSSGSSAEGGDSTPGVLSTNVAVNNRAMSSIPEEGPAVRNTFFKATAVERNPLAVAPSPQFKLHKSIEIEELNEIKEIVPPVRQNSALLATKPVVAASSNAIAMALEQEAEEARQKTVEDLERARALAQSMAAEEELKRVQERNRMKEETRLRAEERARAQFALHKQQQAQSQQQQQRTTTAVTRSASVANESLLAADRALASVQQQTSSNTTPVVEVVHVVTNNVINHVTTSTRVTTTTSSSTNNVQSSSQPRIEEP